MWRELSAAPVIVPEVCREVITSTNGCSVHGRIQLKKTIGQKRKMQSHLNVVNRVNIAEPLIALEGELIVQPLEPPR